MSYFPLWLESRKNYFFSLVVEIFIILQFRNFLFCFDSNNKLFYYFLITLFILFWIFISYLFGRYLNLKLENKIIDKKSLLSTTSTIMASFIFYYSFLYKEFLFYKNSKEDMKIFLIISTIGLLSHLMQFTTKFFYNKFSKRHEKFIFIGSEKLSSILKNEIKLSKLFMKISFRKKYMENFNSINFDKFDGVICEDKKQLNKFRNYFKNKSIYNFNVIDIEYFSKKYLQRYPPSIFYLFKNNYFHGVISKNHFQFFFKRIGDLIFSFLLLIILSPLMILVSIIIGLFDKGPIFYRQRRSGKGGKTFKITKFRTMCLNAEDNGPIWSKKNDQRITKIGKVLRKMRLDELPQLISVLKGDMSLIGPRPERPELEKNLKEQISQYTTRYNIKPGLSGWAQVNYCYGASIKDAKNKLSYDLFYLKNFSTLFDFLIFFKTIRVLFNFQGSEPEKVLSKKSL